MGVPKCSLENRPAASSILKELFCELHREKIVDRFSIDFFPMLRISETEEQFIVRGRHKQPVQSVRPPSPKKFPKPKAK